ncbi:DUF4304 domain-containing protein [Frondihabitans australicus]|uniref:Uncharacterized protein DUF4304 n=1 Tax=Frondihabitans australicus TaxID=386892 RepID=A0A495IBM1_9MICO|nr:DUF4304 domain-containing protein [Frondihabitans australicus]RKR73394.1 uncharacterized protein DUF4304 [Frondihabitans australicus]
MDARDAFRDMLRDRVGPGLRELGFAGSGNTWRLRGDAGDWAVVNFQKSQWGSSQAVRFYINMLFVLEPMREFLVDYEQRRPSRIPGRFDHVWEKRLDRLPRKGLSMRQIWDFADGADAEGVAAEVVSTVEVAAMPTFRRLLDRKSFVAELANAENGGMLGGWLSRTSPEGTRALILSEAGPGNEVGALLQSLEAGLRVEDGVEEGTWDHRQLAIIEWIRRRLEQPEE